MRSSLLMLTATVATVYLMSLILVHLYIHLSLDSATRSQERSLTVGESVAEEPLSVTDELLRFESDHRSGSALDPVPEEVNNSLEIIHPCPESRQVAGVYSRETERLASRRSETKWKDNNHLHPNHSQCVDLPHPAGKESTDSDDIFHRIGEEFVYSAYWDNRIESEPTIRIIALLKKPTKKKDIRTGFFCHVPTPLTQNPRDNTPTSTQPAIISVATTFYEMCENHGKEFGGWILSCKLPPAVSQPPCSVYVSSKEVHTHLNETGVIRLRIFRIQPERKSYPDRTSFPDRFAVCVPPLFGRITEKTFADFVELTQTLGADHLFFYVPVPVPVELRSAIDRYDRLGVVTAVPWTVPVPEHAVWYSGQLLAINDCLYRTMHAFQFVAFNDLDEFIVPHRHSHWPEMVEALRQLPSQDPDAAGAAANIHCGYSFKSAFFDPITEPVQGQGHGHRVDYELRSNLRTKSFSRIRNKLIVAPSLLFELGIHHISRPLEVGKCSVLKVDPEIAFVHHYRECTTSFDGKMNCRSLCQDDSMSAFMSVLRPSLTPMTLTNRRP